MVVSESMECYDLVVIGAGWYGLAAAKTYLQLHTSDKMIIVDAASSLGGAWAEHRLYPGLKSNNMLGTYEYPDFPMKGKKYGLEAGQHIPGSTIHQYLQDFAQEFGILQHIRLETKVDSVKSTDDGQWIVQTLGRGNSILKTKKLIVATGLTSQPYSPNYVGQEVFGGPIFHSKDFARNQDTMQKCKNAVVIGGSKSAWDVAYTYARAGVQVDMVIRASGHGPVWMAPPYVTPFKIWLEKLVHTRFLTWFSPCVWGHEDGFARVRRYLHQTLVGRFFVDVFWRMLGGDVESHNQYQSHPELQKLKPWHPAFYIGSGLSIHNYPTSFFDMVKQGSIRIHIDEILRLEPNMVCLTTDTRLKADVLVCCTGWRKEPSIQFSRECQEKMGLRSSSVSELEPFAEAADNMILANFPRLQTQPENREELELAVAERLRQPLRLYKFMVPPAMVAQRNIAFCGMCSTISTSMVATAQALWISAFFDNKLDRMHGQEVDIKFETMLHTQYGKWRHPTGYGPRLPDFVFDALPYLDMLLRDVGMTPHRKPTRFREITEAYGPEDYVGLAEEWRQCHSVSATHVEEQAV